MRKKDRKLNIKKIKIIQLGKEGEEEKKKKQYQRELHAVKAEFMVGGEEREMYVRSQRFLTVAGDSELSIFRMLTRKVSSKVRLLCEVCYCMGR